VCAIGRREGLAPFPVPGKQPQTLGMDLLLDAQGIRRFGRAQIALGVGKEQQVGKDQKKTRARMVWRFQPTWGRCLREAWMASAG